MLCPASKATVIICLSLTAITLALSVGYDDPKRVGGSSIIFFKDILYGEPLNVIISNNSSPSILNMDGFQNYYRSILFDDECMGFQDNSIQYSTIDGPSPPSDNTGQLKVIRQFFPNKDNRKDMSCHEIKEGGNHCRVYQQISSKAWFLGCSVQLKVRRFHTIIPNGYDEGRDQLVKAANVNSTTNYAGVTYKTEVEYVKDLLRPHPRLNHDIPIDARTAIVTVTLSKSKV